MLNIPVRFDDLLKAIKQLSDEQKRELVELLKEETGVPESVENSNQPRIPDLFPGIWMSDDFDDPLPDEFWLGEDA